MTFHIAYSCNSRYVEQTMVSMVSVMENNRGDKIIFYLIEDGVDYSAIQLIKKMVEKYGQSLIVKKLVEMIGNNCVEGDKGHPKTIYAKIFLSDICNADRILYLDSDTVICDSLSELWKMDLQDCYIAGVKMPYSDQIKSKLRLNTNDAYVCDGVLMLNLEKWRTEDLKQKCLDYINDYHGEPFMLSEGTVNYIAQKHVKILEPKYNLMSSMILWTASQVRELFNCPNYYSNQDVIMAREKPVIVHYLNELYIRPWFANSDHPYRKIYLEYRTKAGYNGKLLSVKQRKKTLMLKFLNKYMPFCMFKQIYRNVKKG